MIKHYDEQATSDLSELTNVCLSTITSNRKILGEENETNFANLIHYSNKNIEIHMFFFSSIIVDLHDEKGKQTLQCT